MTFEKSKTLPCFQTYLTSQITETMLELWEVSPSHFFFCKHMFGECLHLFLNTQHSCIKVMLPGFYTGGQEKLGVILIANLYFTGFPFHLELQGLHPHKLKGTSKKILLRCPERFLNNLRAMIPFSVLSELWPWHCTMEASVSVPSTAKTQHETLSSGQF